MPEDSNKIIEKDSLLFIGTMIQKAVTFSTQIDTQSNILIGLNVAFLGFLINQGSTDAQLLRFLSVAAAVVSLTFAIYAIHPPKFLTHRKNEKQSLFYNKTITSLTQENYLQKIAEAAYSNRGLLDEGNLELYNLYKYYYSPKRTLFISSQKFFLAAVILEVLVFVLKLSGY